MSDNSKKKKLVLKKGNMGGKSIADKIVQHHQAQDKQQEKDAQIEKERQSLTKKNLFEAEKPEKATTEPGETKITIPVEKSPETPEERLAAKEKSKTSKGYLREDILKKEEHKKFFIKAQSGKSPRAPGDVSISTPVPKHIKITEYVRVGDLAKKLNLKTSDIIAKLMRMGVMATITQSVDAETASLVCAEYGCTAEVVSLYEETLIEEESDNKEHLIIKPPVVTIMGHVDHGKTKLLDALRETDIASGEAGGITQHIGAYQVVTPKGRITFLDTPGHEAFTAMRARGAQVTDIVVLVVAANDGVMPQTVEAIKHAQDAKVPIIVAINKIDLPEANQERVIQQLGNYNIVPEEWGGSSPMVGISALKKINLDKLEDTILTVAEMLQLKADPEKRAVGTVIEAKLDQGRGPVATVLISAGTISMGSPFIAGMESGRIRAIFNDRGEKIKTAGPATPVEILGLSGVPNAGDPFHVLASEKEAKTIMEKRQELNRQQQAQKIKKVKLENLSEVIRDGKIEDFKVIIKADVRGSVEAIKESLEKLTSSEIKVTVIYDGAGEITESDVMLASAANALIIAFNTRANSKVRDVADREGVEIRHYNIIYQVLDDVKMALVGMLSPDISEKNTGELEVRETYKISSIGVIAGCMVKSGVIKRNSMIRVIRGGSVIYTGKLKSLKRFKEDVAEVKESYECGILIDGYNDIKVEDIIEVYEKVETARTLDDLIDKKKSTENS